MATLTYAPGFDGPTTINHGDIVTITGSGFGTKTVAAPLVFDDGSGPPDVRDLWDDAWPFDCQNPEFDTQRRPAPFRDVAPVHTRTGRYITGCHGEGLVPDFDPFRGPNVSLFKDIPDVNVNVTPLDFYLSWWQQFDPLFNYGTAGNPSVKMWSYGYNANVARGILAVQPNVQTATDAPRWQVAAQEGNPPDDLLMQPGPDFFKNAAVLGTPPRGIWQKIEVEARMGPAPGFIRLYENGQLLLNYTGRTDVRTEPTRRILVGHFFRPYQQPNNYRYFADVYVDRSQARIVLTNQGALLGGIGETAGIASVREMQVPVAWSSTSIQFRVNLGVHGSVGTGHLYVVNASGTVTKVADVAFEAEPVENPPVITSPPAAAGVETSPFSYQVTATNNPTSFGATSEELPPGLDFNVSTGLLNGTPTETTSRGDYIVPLTATNPVGSAELPLATVIRPVIPQSGTGEKPAAIGQAPDPTHPLSVDLAVSWLFNDGTDISPATTAANGGSTGATHNITMDYTASANNYTWIANGSTWDLQVRAPNPEAPLLIANDLVLGTTWSWDFKYFSPFGGNSVPLVLGNVSAGQIFISTTTNSTNACNPNIRFNNTNHDLGLSNPHGTTYHIVLSSDAGNVSVYINGTFQGILTGIPSITADRLFTNTLGAHSQSLVANAVFMRVWIGRALTASEAESLTLNPYDVYGVGATAPVITSALTASGQVGVPFVYGIVAEPLPNSYDATLLPAGLNVNTDLGIIYGTPTAAGVTAAEIQATNSLGSDTETLTITIDAAPTPPEITSDLFAEGREGIAFSYQIAATNTPTSFGAIDLPAGLNVNNATGLIDGTATVNGTFPVTISAGNADGTDIETLVITLEPAYTVPVITSPLTASGTVGEPFSYTLTAEGDDAELTIDAADLPAGLTVQEPAFIGIDGTPSVDGVFPVDLTATNPAGTDAEILVLTIAPIPGELPEITSPLFVSAQVGAPFEYQITATEGAFAFGAANLPGGVVLDANAGTITGVATEIGVFSVPLTATNGVGTGPEAILTLVVELATPAIISAKTASAPIGILFAYQIVTTHVAASYSASGLPPGLTLDTELGLIQGTPTETGTFVIEMTAPSLVPGEGATASLALRVFSEEEPPVEDGTIFIQPYHRPQG